MEQSQLPEQLPLEGPAPAKLADRPVPVAQPEPSSEQVPREGAALARSAEPPVPFAQPEPSQASILHALWRRRWVALLALAACIGGGFLHVSRTTPLYTSTSYLYVEQSGPRILRESGGVLTGNWNYLYTQRRLLMSPSILDPATKKLSEQPLTIADLDPSVERPGKQSLSELLECISFLCRAAENLGKGPHEASENVTKVGGDLRAGLGQSELLTTMSLLSRSAEEASKRPLNAGDVMKIVGDLRGGLSVSVGKEDDILSVSFTCPNPKLASYVANLVVESYIDFHSVQNKSTAARWSEILTSEKEKYDKVYADKIKELYESEGANPALLYESKGGNIVLESLARLYSELNEARRATIDAKANRESIEELKGDPAKIRAFKVEIRRATGEMSAPVGEYASIREELSRLQAQILDARAQFTDSHPAVKALQSKIADAERRLAEADKKLVEVELAVATERYRAACEREKEIRRSYEEQRQQANAQIVLQSQLEQARKQSDLLLSRINEMNLTRDTENTGKLYIRIVEAAMPSSSPSSPNKMRVMSMALILGIMLGVGLALGLEWLNQGIRSSDEVPDILGAPVLGVIPCFGREEAGRGRLRWLCYLVVSAIPYFGRRQADTMFGRQAEEDPNSEGAEAYRAVRTAVQYAVRKTEERTILVTSPEAGDGKTTLASNLAVVLAQAGQRTLLVDADFHRPNQHKIFGLAANHHGLSGVVLRDGTQLDDVIQPTSVKGLDLLPAGRVPSDPHKMLNSQEYRDRFAGVLKTLRERTKPYAYERIVLDSPPLLARTDARILGAMEECDGTILVLRAEKSHRREVKRSRDALESVGARVIGAVLNAAPPGQGYYYYYYHGRRSHKHDHRHGGGRRAAESSRRADNDGSRPPGPGEDST